MDLSESYVQDDNEDEFDAYFEREMWKKETKPAEQVTQPSDALLLEKIRELGKQEKLSMKSNVLQYYEDLQRNRRIDEDLFEMVLVVLSAPATQVSVERSFSALALLLEQRRININGKKIDDVLVCGLNRDILAFVDFEHMQENDENKL